MMMAASSLSLRTPSVADHNSSIGAMTALLKSGVDPTLIDSATKEPIIILVCACVQTW